MIDASAVVDLLVGAPDTEALAVRVSDEVLAAPHPIDHEVVAALRRMVLRGDLTAARAQAALDDFDLLRLRRWPAEGPLRQRAFDLQDAVSAHDAGYVALAEGLDCPLVTRDGRLARSSGHAAVVEAP